MRIIKICVVVSFFLLCISCGQKENVTESKNNISKNIVDANYNNDITDIKHILVSWNGEGKQFDVIANDSLVKSLENLAWLARRERLGAELVYEGITADEIPCISESALLPENSDEIISTEKNWVRIFREGDTASATITAEYQDICAYVENEDAYIAIQRVAETECWNVWRVPGFGDWMNKSFMIFYAIKTGLL